MCFHWILFSSLHISSVIIVIENMLEESLLCYKPGTFYKQLLNLNTSGLCSKLRVRLHFFQSKKKKKREKVVLLLSLLWIIVGGKLTSHHTSIPYFLKLSRPDSLLYDFSFKSCYNGYAQERVQLE